MVLSYSECDPTPNTAQFSLNKSSRRGKWTGNRHWLVCNSSAASHAALGCAKGRTAYSNKKARQCWGHYLQRIPDWGPQNRKVPGTDTIYWIKHSGPTGYSGLHGVAVPLSAKANSALICSEPAFSRQAAAGSQIFPRTWRWQAFMLRPTQPKAANFD